MRSTSTRPAAITFAAVTLDDFEELVLLRTAAMKESLERLGRYDLDRSRERLRQSFSPWHTRFILVDGEPVGFYAIRSVIDGLYLDHLYIHPRNQRQGIGSQVIRRLIDEADAHQKPIRLNALRGSASNRFYEGHGFEKTNEDEWDVYYLRTPLAG